LGNLLLEIECTKRTLEDLTHIRMRMKA